MVTINYFAKVDVVEHIIEPFLNVVKLVVFAYIDMNLVSIAIKILSILICLRFGFNLAYAIAKGGLLSNIYSVLPLFGGKNG
ncbi:MAG: hypothetical protein R3Y12_01830 [Clostridia bacterium]